MTATQTVNGPWNSKDLQQEKYTKDKKIVSTAQGQARRNRFGKWRLVLACF